ncbi:hypothetical protein Tco_1541378 [Tanacetum coccineum]
MATMAENVISEGSENHPKMLEKGMYDSWKNRIILYIRGKENGEMLKDSIDNGPFQLKPKITAKYTDGVTDICRPQKFKDLSAQEKLRYDNDIKVVNILLGLPVDIYTLINHYLTTKEIWDHVKGHIAKQCTTKKRVKDSEWFKEKILLAQAQKAGVVLNNEQQDFLADSLEETDDCEDLQLQATSNFKANHIDAYDLDYDNEATANAIFMENLSPVGSINDDTVEPRYDSDILSEVPHYDTYHESNYDIQELEYIENIVSNNESYDELTSNKNIISYTDYMVTIGNDEDNYVPPPVQNNDRILSVIEHMRIQVEKCNMVNQETQSVNKSLTSELEKYKERVKTLEYKFKNSVSDREKF